MRSGRSSIAIITGASQRIGRATALRLACDFSAVVLAARNQEELEQAASEIRAIGAESLVCPWISANLNQPKFW